MSRFAITAVAAVAFGLSVGACEAAPGTDAAAPAGSATPAEAAAPQSAPLTPAGAPAPLTAESAEDEGIQYAASVVQLDAIPDTDAKLFGTAGGDPAINGLYTYLAVYQSTADGWAVYRLGDFNSYTVLSTGQNRVDLEVSQSTWNDAAGTADTQVSKIIVQWTPTEGGPPSSVTVTPGR
ncbi:hypothetical protein [Brevundimonas bacteroides]|uniref:hypothetical protein n=1 Tax=Brevundimonas bacteroides TaxID=74311 RepID=UPI000495E94C|nr:hypothetical protein [Brevundimonas bacteroides]